MPRTYQYYPGAYRRWLASQNELNALIASRSGGNPPLPQTAAPVISPNGGTFTDAPLVTISTTTPGSIVYYTLNGTNPDGNSTQYTVPFIVGNTSTLKCIAVAPGFSPSVIVSAGFVIGQPKVGTPVFTPGAGTYTTAQTVVISAVNAEDIRYTTDGTTPSGSSPLYNGAITISTTTPLQARGYAPGYQDSDVAAGIYTIGTSTVIDPVPFPASGTNFEYELFVSVTCATPGALIYFTMDGSTPTQASTLYSAPVPITLSKTFKFRAYKAGLTPSGVVTATYNLNTVTMSGWWGSSANSYLASPYWAAAYTPWSRTLENMWTTPFVMNFPAIPSAAGGYRTYIVPNTAPPIESGTQGIFALSPADFADINDENIFAEYDANGWPCSQSGPGGEGYPYRVYRLKNVINGAFTLSIQHQNESP